MAKLLLAKKLQWGYQAPEPRQGERRGPYSVGAVALPIIRAGDGNAAGNRDVFARVEVHGER
ncbi:hypothetical protein K663_12970 [Sphingobium sp. MI1205]|nr:hypothetical protein K663_12970 [Sphingobium sp. MI1205]